MDVTGRPMRSMVVAGPSTVREDRDLDRWVRAAVAFTATLPPKRVSPLRPRRGPRGGP